MKFVIAFLSIHLVILSACGKEKIYIGSTPADPVVRSFLGIPLSDSIDFIRWKLIFQGNQYKLSCNYGVGQPNTNGFVNGGRKIELTGSLEKNKSHYQLHNGQKKLSVAELNEDLLHLLNNSNSLLVGNGGWSYTLNSVTPLHLDQVSLSAGPTVIRDSIAFQGRTPCHVPGVIAPGTECYKLKWYIVLYADGEKNKPGKYKVLGTPWRKEGGITGTWNIVTSKNGRTIYRLNDEKGNGFLYLLKLDEQILVFTDANGKLLVGNEDFSYTINRS
jgi:hypothetical protein